MADALPAALGPLLRAARERLAAHGIADPALDSRLIVEHFSGTTRTEAIAGPGQTVGSFALAAIESALRRRVAGEPVHRILGYRELYGLRLSLSPAAQEAPPHILTDVDAITPP